MTPLSMMKEKVFVIDQTSFLENNFKIHSIPFTAVAYQWDNHSFHYVGFCSSGPVPYLNFLYLQMFFHVRPCY